MYIRIEHYNQTPLNVPVVEPNKNYTAKLCHNQIFIHLSAQSSKYLRNSDRNALKCLVETLS